MRYAPPALLLILLLVLFTGPAGVGPLDVREARDAQVARELVDREEVLTPQYAGDPLFEKPVLAYALEVLTGAGRRDPARSRLARALLATVLVLVTATAGARHFGARAGWLAAGVLATSLAVPLAARSDGTQVLASLCGWTGCAGLADVLFGRPRGRELRLVVTWGALAVALVCAGPLPALWPLAALGLHALLARRPDAWRAARPLAGMVMLAGLALPWYGALAERRGAWFLAHVPAFPYAAAPAGAWLARPALALSSFVVGFFPWSALVPAAALHAATWWRGGPLLRIGVRGPELAEQPLEREWREEEAAHFFVAALLAALVPMLVYPAPPITAALPAVPAGALLLGRFLDHLFEDPARMARPFIRALPLLTLAGSAAAIMLALLATRAREAAPAVRLLATVTLVTSWTPLIATLLGRRRLAALFVGLPVALGTPIATLRVLPALENWLSARAVAGAMNAVSPPLAPLVVLDPEPPSLRLHLRRNIVPATGRVDRALAAWRASDGESYVAFRPGREREVVRAAGVPVEILLRSPTLVLARARVE
jgi:4-amino-4-deoxy-L-arabinose transferase-like glycosyltransferase